MVIIIAPFREVIGEFKAWEISTCILEIYDNKLLVLVSRM